MRARVGDDPATALREHLIDVAETMLGQGHVSAITTREIARSAGVSDGVLYNYFDGKQDLLVTALLRRYATFLARFEASLPVPGQATVEESLVELATSVHALVADTLPIVAGLVSDPGLQRSFIAGIHTEPLGPHRFIRPLVDYLRVEQDAGRVGDVDIESVIHLIVGPALMMGFAEVIGGVSRQDSAERLPLLMRTLLRGIGP